MGWILFAFKGEIKGLEFLVDGALRLVKNKASNTELILAMFFVIYGCLNLKARKSSRVL